MINNLSSYFNKEFNDSNFLFFSIRLSFFLLSYIFAINISDINEIYPIINIYTLPIKSKLYLEFPVFVTSFVVFYILLESLHKILKAKIIRSFSFGDTYHLLILLFIPICLNYFFNINNNYSFPLATKNIYLGISFLEIIFSILLIFIIKSHGFNMKIYSNKFFISALASFLFCLIINQLTHVEVIYLYILIFSFLLFTLDKSKLSIAIIFLNLETLFLLFLKFRYTNNSLLLLIIFLLLIFLTFFTFKKNIKIQFLHLKFITIPLIILAIYSNSIFPFIQQSGFTWLNHGMFGLLTLTENINLYSDIKFSIHGFVPDHLIGFFTFKNFGFNIHRLMQVTYYASIFFSIIFYFCISEIFSFKKTVIFLLLIKVNFLFINYFDRVAPWENEFRFFPFVFIILNLILYIKYKKFIFLNFILSFLVILFFSGLDVFISCFVSLLIFVILNKFLMSNKKLSIDKKSLIFYSSLNILILSIYIVAFLQLSLFLNADLFNLLFSLLFIFLFYISSIYINSFNNYKAIFLISISQLSLLVFTFSVIKQLSLNFQNFFSSYFNSAKILGGLQEIFRFPKDSAPQIFDYVVKNSATNTNLLDNINAADINLNFNLDSFSNFIYNNSFLIVILLLIFTSLFFFITRNRVNNIFFSISFFLCFFCLVHLNKFFMLPDNGRILIVLKFLSFLLILNLFFYFYKMNKYLISLLLFFPLFTYSYTPKIKMEFPFNDIMTDIYPSSLKEEIIYFYKKTPNQNFFNTFIKNSNYRKNELICLLDSQINDFLLQRDYKYEYRIVHKFSVNDVTIEPYSHINISNADLCDSFPGIFNTYDYFNRDIKN